jgi:hypothetical protein
VPEAVASLVAILPLADGGRHRRGATYRWT